MAATLILRLTGGVSNTDPDASLGGVQSTTELSATAMNSLFDNVDSTEASSGDTEYRALDIYNSGDATATSVEIYMSTETSSTDSSVDMGPDSGTQTIANESTAPSAPAITFAHYNTASKLSVSDIASSGSQRIWFKRIVTASAGNDSNDQGTIKIDYA